MGTFTITAETARSISARVTATARCVLPVPGGPDRLSPWPPCGNAATKPRHTSTTAAVAALAVKVSNEAASWRRPMPDWPSSVRTRSRCAAAARARASAKSAAMEIVALWALRALVESRTSRRTSG